MKSILYAICFCTVGSIMWFSIGFSVIEKQYNIDIMCWKKIIMAFSMAIVFSGFMTFISYIIFSGL